MKEWLREVNVRRPGVFFFHSSPSLLICDSVHAHLTADVKNMGKHMNAVLAVIQPLDIGVNRTQQAQQKQRVYMQSQWLTRV